MLRHIDIKGFKSYQRATFPLGSLTALVGLNASGKSNLIEALRFVKWLAQGGKLYNIQAVLDANAQRSSRADRLNVRGSLEDLPFDGATEMAFACVISNGPNETYEFEFTLGLVDHELRVIGETLSRANDESRNPWYYKAEVSESRSSHDMKVAYNNFARGGKKPQITCSDYQLALTQLDSPAKFTSHEAARRIPRACEGPYRNSSLESFFWNLFLN